MKGRIPRKGLIAHWQNSYASSLVNVVSTFYLHTHVSVSLLAHCLCLCQCVCVLLIVCVHAPCCPTCIRTYLRMYIPAGAPGGSKCNSANISSGWCVTCVGGLLGDYSTCCHQVPLEETHRRSGSRCQLCECQSCRLTSMITYTCTYVQYMRTYICMYIHMYVHK